MQWFKSALVVSSAMLAVAMAASTNGCSSSPAKGDGGTDAKSDSIVKPDGNGGPDGQTGCPTADPACEVCDVSSFSATAQSKPIGPNSKACTTQQVTDFVNACFTVAGGSQTKCDAWQTSVADAGASCLGCTFTLQTDAAWGVLVCTQSGCSLNVPGCVDLALGQVSQENTTSTGSCGDFLNSDYGCQDAACSSCQDPDFTTCVNDAIGAECKQYADAFQNSTQCAALNSDTPPAALSNCFASSQSGYSVADLTNFTNYFCGQ